MMSTERISLLFRSRTYRENPFTLLYH